MIYLISIISLSLLIYKFNRTLKESNLPKNKIIEKSYPNLNQKSMVIGLCDESTDINQFNLLDKSLTQDHPIILFNGFEPEDSKVNKSPQYPIFVPGYVQYNNRYYLLGLTIMDQCYYTSLITFDSVGEFLDIRFMGIGKCGPDFCFCCNENINIKNGDIFLEGFSRTYDCNSDGILEKKVILNKYKKRVILGTADYFEYQDIYNIDTTYNLVDSLIESNFNRERDCLE